MTENQQKAHDLFFQTDLNQQQISDLIGVNRKTLYGWIKQGNWLRAKHAANYAPMVLVEQYYAQLSALNNKVAARDEPFPTKEEADIVRKISMTIEKIKNEKQAVCEIIELFTNFTNELKKKDIELTKKIIVHMDEYVKKLTDEGNTGKISRQEQEFEQEYQQWIIAHTPPCPSSSEGADSVSALIDNRIICPDAADSKAANQAGHTVNCQLPAVNCPQENGVQNKVHPKLENEDNRFMVNDLHEKSDETLSTNKNKKQGVAPPPQNRRERRLLERILRTKTNPSKRK